MIFFYDSPCLYFHNFIWELFEILQLVLTDRVKQSEKEQNNYQQQQQIFVHQNLPQQVFSLSNNLLSDLNRQTNNMTLTDHSPCPNQTPLDHTPFSNQNPPNSEGFLTQSNESFNYQSHDSSPQPIKTQGANDNLPEERKRLLLSILHSEKFCKIRRDNPALNRRIIEMLHKKKELLNRETSDRGVTLSQKIVQTSLMSAFFHQPSIFSSAFHQQTFSYSSTSQQHPVFSTQPLQHSVVSKTLEPLSNEDNKHHGVTSSSLPSIGQLSSFNQNILDDVVDSSMVGNQGFMQDDNNKKYNNFDIDEFINKLNADKEREDQLDSLNDVIFNDKPNLNKDTNPLADIEDDSLLSNMDDTPLFLDDFSLFDNLFNEDKGSNFLNDIKHGDASKNNTTHDRMEDGKSRITWDGSREEYYPKVFIFMKSFTFIVVLSREF